MKVTKKDQIMDTKPPNRCLYRYRSMHSPELKRVFNQGEVYLASPLTFNDPFDCRPRIIPPSSLRGDQYFKRLIRERSPNCHNRKKRSILRKGKILLQDSEHLKKIYEDALRELGVYCLSEKRDDILMWSHYSDGHKGICLEFDASKEWTLFWTALKVIYSEEYPCVDLTKMGNDEEFSKCLLTKSSHWEYEQEWRILNRKGAGYYNFKPELLTGVIFGALILDDQREIILEWISNYPTKINAYQAKINNTYYKLDIERI